MDRILNKTKTARQHFFAENEQLLRELVEVGQMPSALFIGCSDSRVVPEQLLEAKPGEYMAPILIAGSGVGADSAVAISLMVFLILRLTSLLGATIYIASILRQRQRGTHAVTPEEMT